MEFLDKTLKNKLEIFYEALMIILAIVVVTILVLETFIDFSESTTQFLKSIDLYILLIFAIDYFTRLIFLAKDKKYFMKNNKADLVAILPFSSVFRVARVARLARLGRLARLSRMSRLGRLFRVIAVFKKGSNMAKEVFFTNGLHVVTIITSLVVVFAAMGMYKLEGGLSVDSFGDALWWSFVTTTTVGYGDISPVTVAGRVLASFLMLIGIGFVGMLTGTIATYFVNKTEEFVKAGKDIEEIKEHLDNFENLSITEVKKINTKLLKLKQQEN